MKKHSYRTQKRKNVLTGEKNCIPSLKVDIVTCNRSIVMFDFCS